MSRILVTGAGGFIGSHLVTKLKSQGHFVRGADIKLPEFRDSDADEFYLADLRDYNACFIATEGVDQVYHLAANMGGMGFISVYQSLILHDNSLIDINMLEAAKDNNVERFFYSSSACVYPEHLQTETNLVPLKEEDAYPAQPQDTYGWEKLMMEILCEHYSREYPIKTRIARFHNIFGPYGTYQGGKEKAPAAMCRKVATAKLTGQSSIDIWGDGEQTRSFCYVDDCVDAIIKLMNSDYDKPLNIGQDRMLTINELAGMVMTIADINLEKRHVEGPQGVRGRNSDNTELEEILDFKTKVSLEEGLKITYDWIEQQINS